MTKIEMLENRMLEIQSDNIDVSKKIAGSLYKKISNDLKGLN